MNYDKITKVWNKIKKVEPSMVRGPEVNALKTKNMMPLANLCEVLPTWLPKLKITERKIYSAFWLSKMTCADENEDGKLNMTVWKSQVKCGKQDLKTGKVNIKIWKPRITIPRFLVKEKTISSVKFV